MRERLTRELDEIARRCKEDWGWKCGLSFDRFLLNPPSSFFKVLRLESKWHLEQCPSNAIPRSNGTKLRIGFTQQHFSGLSCIKCIFTLTFTWVHRSLRPLQSGCRRMQLQRDKSSRSSRGQRFFLCGIAMMTRACLDKHGYVWLF